MAAKNKTEESEYENAIVAREKPLNQTQLKNLRELVEGDFRDLSHEVRAEIERRHRAKVEEVEERYRDMADLDKARKALRIEASKLYDRLVEKVRKTAEKDGLAIKSNQSPESLVSVTVTADSIIQDGKDEELRKVNDAKGALIETALRVVAREQRAVDRVCLLQGISATGAHEIIRDLPEAADILPLVSAEMAMKESEAMELLMSDVKALNGGE